VVARRAIGRLHFHRHLGVADYDSTFAAMRAFTDARTPDKFEAESAQFFLRTRAEYLRRAATEPQRFVVLDANRERGELQKDLEKLLATL
jgi:dTMP kinase